MRGSSARTQWCSTAQGAVLPYAPHGVGARGGAAGGCAQLHRQLYAGCVARAGRGITATCPRTVEALPRPSPLATAQAARHRTVPRCSREKLLLARYFHREVRPLGFEWAPRPTCRGDLNAGGAPASRSRRRTLEPGGRQGVRATAACSSRPRRWIGRFTLRLACSRSEPLRTSTSHSDLREQLRCAPR